MAHFETIQLDSFKSSFCRLIAEPNKSCDNITNC